MNNQPDILTGVIKSLAFGGKGILRHQGMVVFVPFTAVGDTVRCKITKKKKNFAEAELLEILQPSPDRTEAPCPYFGKCGGCQIQHLKYEAQIDYKRQSVEEALKRIGKISGVNMEMVPAKQQWHYRRHITLTLQPNHGAWQGGYIAIDNSTLLSIKCCPIFIEEEHPLLAKIQKLLHKLECTTDKRGHLSIWKNGEKFILHFHVDKVPANAKTLFTAMIAEHSEIEMIKLSSPEDTLEIGKSICTVTVNDLVFNYSTDAFLQVHPEQSSQIYQKILQMAPKNASILDLYCGIGISSILLAKAGARVLGVEGNSIAIDLAEKNGKINSAEAKFVCGDVKNLTKQLLEQHRPEMVLINPPRTGLQPSIIQDLLAYKPDQLIYVSCMPPTLARDLAELCQTTYQVSSCHVFDMFPQTAHVETVIHLKKKS